MWEQGGRTAAYMSAVGNILASDNGFINFRHNNTYRAIIGYPVVNQAYEFYKQAIKDPDIAKNYKEFRKLDDIGRPTNYQMGGEWVSNNTCRYMDSIRLLKKEFGSLDGMKIFEIGSGFGGLAHCIHTQWKPASYRIWDLQPAMELAQKVLRNLGHTVIPETPSEQMDLTIAEYSITEFDEKSLMDYTTTFLYPSKRVFIRCNLRLPETKERWLNALRQNFHVNVYQEEGNAVWFNCIVVGKSDEVLEKG